MPVARNRAGLTGSWGVIAHHLTTTRLRLRLPVPGDVPDLIGILGDPRVMRWVGSGGPLSGPEISAALTSSIRLWHRQGLGLYTVVHTASGQVVGRAGVTVWDLDRVHRTAAPLRPGHVLEVGIVLSHEWSGQGLAAEAVRAVVAGVRAHCSHQLIWTTHPRNAPSIRLARSLGASIDAGSPLTASNRLVFRFPPPPSRHVDGA